MEAFDINGLERSIGSKSEIRRLKGMGFIPGILYYRTGNVPVSIDEHQLNLVLNKYGADILLKVNLEGGLITAKIQEVQRDPVSLDILHIDLMPLEDKYLH